MKFTWPQFSTTAHFKPGLNFSWWIMNVHGKPFTEEKWDVDQEALARSRLSELIGPAMMSVRSIGRSPCMPPEFWKRFEETSQITGREQFDELFWFCVVREIVAVRLEVPDAGRLSIRGWPLRLVEDVALASELAINAIVSQAANEKPPNGVRRDDTKTDTKKNRRRKTRIMHEAHRRCGRAFLKERNYSRQQDLKSFAEQWFEEETREGKKDLPKSHGSLYRTLLENRSDWDHE